MQEETKKLVHYKGYIGEFDYNSDIWEICVDEDFSNRDYLHFKNIYVENLELPKGLKSCRLMFYGCVLPKDFTLGDKFDTSTITDMSDMFLECKLSENFTLGHSFDTYNVTNMNGMFCSCKLPENFSLGYKFDTSKVLNMECMFAECEIPENFLLGDKFYTSKVLNMSYMFEDCKMPLSFKEKYRGLIEESQK